MQTYKTSFKLALALGLTVFHMAALSSRSAAAAVGASVSPAAISNQYSGYITIQVSNLTAGATIVVQKFVDINSNGVVDTGDLLVQQFQLSDGQPPALFSGVTNINIAFDSNPASGAITTQLSPATEGVAQRFVAQYLFVVSSPTAQFTSITNTFLVTNSAYSQKFTGTVTAGGSPVPYAVVFLSRPGGDGGFNPLWGAMADASGNYKIKAAAGTYRLVAFQNNYVVNLGAVPQLTLSNGATINTNLVISNATRTISGRMVDAGNSGIGLPGILMAAQSATKDLGLGSTDTNGNFVVPALAEQYGFGEEQQPLDFHGYLGSNNSPTNVDATSGSVVGVTLALPKATALIYGNVLDGNNNPVSGVRMYGNSGTNGNGAYQGDATTDPNGNYAMGVDADLWSPSVDNGNNSLFFPNYIFSQGPPWVSNNGGPGTNVTAGAAIQANFRAALATNHINGYVNDNNSNPIIGVQVYAYATISSDSYQSQQNTDSNGHYSLNVANGNWNVNVFCCCDNNSLQSIGNYQCPNGTNVLISNSDGAANFIVQTNTGGGSYLIDGYVTDTLSNPVVGVSVYANNGQGSNLSTSTDITGYYQFTVNNGNWDVSVDCGQLNAQGYGCVSDQQVGVFGFNYDDLEFTVSACGALAVTTISLPDAMLATNYYAQLQNDGCNSPFTWSMTPGSLPLPAGLSISTNGVISGTPTSAAFGGTTNYFSVRVTDHTATTADQLLSIAVYPTLTIANNSLPNGTNGFPYSAQILVTGGKEFYIGNSPDGYGAIYNGPIPPGLNVVYGAITVSNAYLVISGTPTNTGTFSFTIGAQDADGNTVQRNASITIIASSLQITSTSPLTPATVGVNYTNQLQGSGGTPPYNWTIALGSQPLPSNLSLSTNGVISGTPTTAGTNNFIVRITDHNAVTTTKSFALVVNSVNRPTISSPVRLSSNRFQFTVNGIAGSNYTVQYALKVSTNNSGWLPLVVTNPGVASFTITDPNATNTIKFYRVKQGP